MLGISVSIGARIGRPFGTRVNAGKQTPPLLCPSIDVERAQALYTPGFKSWTDHSFIIWPLAQSCDLSEAFHIYLWNKE